MYIFASSTNFPYLSNGKALWQKEKKNNVEPTWNLELHCWYTKSSSGVIGLPCKCVGISALELAECWLVPAATRGGCVGSVQATVVNTLIFECTFFSPSGSCDLAWDLVILIVFIMTRAKVASLLLIFNLYPFLVLCTWWKHFGNDQKQTTKRESICLLIVWFFRVAVIL